MNHQEKRFPLACVVIPTYNNKLTIEGVVTDILKFTSAVVVVDDGSTDGTGEILAAVPGITVITHAGNKGKGAALATGLEYAANVGYPHAITMDGDGQHLARDFPAFSEALQTHPDALVIGTRDLSGRSRRLKSRILRAHSNFWVWVLTGKWVADSQSGFRAYPLPSTQEILLNTTKYDYEIEVLVKGLWMGIPVIEVPIGVEYVSGSKSHFRPFVDFMRVFNLILSLSLQKTFIPAPLLKLIHLKSYCAESKNRGLLSVLRETLSHECPSARHFSLSVGLGVFFGIAPLWGFQMSAAVLAAHKLRLSKVVSLIASNISFPAAIPFIVYASLLMGRFLLSGTVDRSLRPDTADPFSSISIYAIEYISGSFILAAVAGIMLALLSYWVLRLTSFCAGGSNEVH